jgi:5-formyltetrahydrofolate cyclo-ligase
MEFNGCYFVSIRADSCKLAARTELEQSMDIAERKKILRREMREKLSAIGGEFRAAAGRVIVEKIVSSPAWREAQTVLLFSPLASEPDIAGLLDEALTAGKKACFPRVQGNGLAIYQVRRREDLRAASFGIPEPDPAVSAPVSPTDINLALIPGLAFGANGHRLGRGKGCYDRFLSTTGTLTVGVGFHCQRVEQIPVAPHDVRLDLVVTEE